MPKFVPRDQSQLYLMPPDLRDWLPANDLAHFVVEAVERVSMSAFEVNERGTGSAQLAALQKFSTCRVLVRRAAAAPGSRRP